MKAQANQLTAFRRLPKWQTDEVVRRDRQAILDSAPGVRLS